MFRILYPFASICIYISYYKLFYFYMYLFTYLLARNIGFTYLYAFLMVHV
jgi:hypothetical protein